MKENIKTTFEEKGLRFLLRDLIGEECVDYVVDVTPKRRKSKLLFPFREVRRWKTADAAMIAGTDDPRKTMEEWSAAMTDGLTHRGHSRITVVPLDNLYLDLQDRRWWKQENRALIWQLCEALRVGPNADWSKLIHDLVAQGAPNSHSRILHRLHPHGLMLGGKALRPTPDVLALIKRFKQTPRSSPRGYWNIQHATLTVAEFVLVFEPADIARDLIHRLANRWFPALTSVAQSPLVRSPEEWIAAFAAEMKSEALLTAVAALRELMYEAGLRPLTDQPPPLLAPETGLSTVLDLAGATFVPAELVPLLERKVQTIAELLRTPPAQLSELAPVLPSDIRAIQKTLGAFGYTYPYKQDELPRFRKRS